MVQDIYPHKLNNQYHPDQKPDADSIILYFTQDGLLHRLLKKEDLEEIAKVCVEKDIFVFAEILIPELVNSLDDEKSLQDTFDQYCAGRLWEHNSYIKNVDKISNLCNVPF